MSAGDKVALGLIMIGCVVFELRSASPAAATAPQAVAERKKIGEAVLGDGVLHQIWAVESDEQDDDHPPRKRGLLQGTNYVGTARKAAKLSISGGTLSFYSDVCHFLTSLPGDQTMRSLPIPISTTATSGRVSLENFNARFKAYILAVSSASDNDYHVIISDSPNAKNCLLNVEVLGLPATTDATYNTLLVVRTALGQCLQLPTSGYWFFDPGVAATIQGSGFFDVSHGSGTIGPLGLKPYTAWELHPVTSLSCP